MNINTIGYIGTTLLSITLLPQVIQTYKSKRTEGISFTFLLLQFMSNVTFIYYGYLIHSLPVISSNIIVLGFTISLLIAKHKYRHIEYTNIV